MKTLKLNHLAYAMALPLLYCQGACSSESDPSLLNHSGEFDPSSSGVVEFRMRATRSLPISTVEVSLRDSSGSLMHSGNLGLNPESDSTTFVLAIPQALGYTITLSASDDTGTQCSGKATFNVVAGQSTEVPITLRCLTPGDAGNKNGNIKVEVQVESQPRKCPEISMMSALPDHAKLGEQLQLSSSATKTGVSFAWSASSGTFSNPKAANTRFTCSQEGPVTLTLAVQTSPECKKEHSVQILCQGKTSEDNPDASPKKVELQFEPRMGSEAFDCKKSYSQLGSGKNAKASPNDFRFFVHDIVLIKADGSEAPMNIENRGDWQGSGVALVDFEDGPASGCFGGAKGTNYVVTGTVAAGDYVGLKFRTGVPQALNHLDPSTLQAPLNASGMIWSWLSGFKFIKLELGAHVLHVGSTSCSGTPPDKVRCAKSNRGEVVLENFKVDSDVVIADLASVFAKSDLSSDQACHSSGRSCNALFDALGLDYATGAPTQSQQFFRRK